MNNILFENQRNFSGEVLNDKEHVNPNDKEDKSYHYPSIADLGISGIVLIGKWNDQWSDETDQVLVEHLQTEMESDLKWIEVPNVCQEELVQQ